MTEPRWLPVARGFTGLTEAPGAKDNATILAWARKIGGWIASFYKHDSIPWCGLFVGYVFLAYGIKGPDGLLGALNWSSWGVRLKVPALGAVLTFQRPGGGHVGFYLGEDAGTYHVLGGNQSDKVGITRIAKARLAAIRWPAGEPLPTGGRVLLQANGAPVSVNER
jgi:uncharacterized protein (TIGR02594 family)